MVFDCGCHSFAWPIRSVTSMIKSEIDELADYAMLEHSEIGEYWTALITLATCSAIKDNLKPKIIQEIEKELKYVKKYATITETEQTSYQKVRKLEWF